MQASKFGTSLFDCFDQISLINFLKIGYVVIHQN